MHTERNGVGISQGFCECIDHNNHPCKIIVDILDLSKQEIENWKVNWEWNWAPKLKKGEKLKSLMKQNLEYEKEEIALCQRMRGLTILNLGVNSENIENVEGTSLNVFLNVILESILVGVIENESMEVEYIEHEVPQVPSVPEQNLEVPELGTQVQEVGTEVQGG